MSNKELENIKQQLSGLTSKLEDLRADASVIISTIDANKLLPTELTQSFSKKLEEYEQSYIGLCRGGEALPIQISDDIEAVQTAIGEYEASLSKAKEKELIWDYFRLCSKDSSTETALEESKHLLVERCRNEEDIANAIKPFELVVNCVRDSITNLVDEVFDAIDSEIGKRIARATDRGDLFIDAAADIGEYLDGSSSLLMPLDAENSEPESDENDKDEKDKDNTLESFDGLLTDCALSFADVNAESFSVPEFKKDVKANPLLANAISVIALMKLLDTESETDLSTALCTEKTVETLIRMGYIAEANVSYNGQNRKYCILTSKGDVCIDSKEAREKIENDNILLPDSLRIKPSELTPSFAAQASIIKAYAKSMNAKALSVVYELEDASNCAAAILLNGETNPSSLVTAAFFNENTANPESFCNKLNTIEDFDIVVLVASEADAEKLREFCTADNENHSINFVVFNPSSSYKRTEKEAADVDEAVEDEVAGSVSWESLRVYEPEKLIYKDKGIPFTDEKSKKASKSFSVKEFKRELTSNPNCKRFVDVMHCVKSHGYVTADNVHMRNENEDCDYSAGCEKLFQLGYLRKTTVGDGAPIYSATDKGNKAFSTKESAAFLHIKPDTVFKLKDELNEAEAALIEIYVRTMDVAEQLGATVYDASYSLAVSYGAFISAYWAEEDFRGITFVGLACSEPAELKVFEEYFEEIVELTEEIVVCGIDMANAENILAWLTESKYADIEEKRIRLYSYETGELVDVNSEVPEETPCGEFTKSVNEDLEEPSAENDGDTAVSNEGEKSDGSEEKTAQPVTEEPSVYVTKRPESKTLDRKHRDELISQMLVSKEFYCAAAYLAASADAFTDGWQTYNQLAYAINDPMNERSYSSSALFDVYFSEGSQVSDYLVISATLRNYFLDHSRFDYNMQSLFDSIKENPVFTRIPRAKNAVRAFMDFKKENGHGLDYYSDYRFSDGDSYEKNLKSICGEAKSLYASLVESVTKETANNERFLETKKLIFAKDGDLAHALSYAANNDTENKDFIKLYLGELFMKDEADVSPANIDASKIDAIIDEAWVAAQEKLFYKRNNIKLVSGLRQNLISRIKEAATVLCRYCELSFVDSATESDKGFINYKRVRTSLLNDLKAAEAELKKADDDGNSQAGRSVLGYTINEIIQKVEGTYNEDNRKFFYAPFLTTNNVLLDKKYIPELSDVEELPELSAAARIEAHFKAEKKSLTERLSDILEGEDDYGTANLIIRYSDSHPEDDYNSDLIIEKVKDGKEFPLNSLDSKLKDFKEWLELAQFYGQIENTVEDKKETILQIVEQWHETTLESENFGFMYKIIAAFRSKIKDDALIRAEELEKNLEAYKTANPGWEENELVKAAVEKIRDRIRVQNYSSAEDMLNRLQANDIEPETSYISTDYLADFVNDYSTYARLAGSTGAFQVPLSSVTKEGKGGRSLLDNWPKSFGFQAKKLEVLLSGLGFNVASIISQQSIQKMDNFFVTLKKPDNGRKTNYKHPISIFGSSAEDSAFRVVCVYGKRKAEDLVDLFNEIGNAKHTLIILDCSLNLPERRELARLAKKNYNGKTFAVIDRVVITYLARHYSQTATNRMLMAIVMPFAYYQPYVAESSRVMPPEIFMGRKTELEKIESPSGVNIVYGGRQLGKSALLRMAQKDIDRDENGDRAILIDIKGLDSKATARKIAEELFDQFVIDEELPAEKTEDWHEIGRVIKNVLRNGNKQGNIPYLLLLLDEADVFIESCEAINYAPFDALKDIQSIGSDRFKFVVAGLRNVVKFNKNVALGNNSVLTHLSSLTVKPFKSAEARELLEVPLAYLGFRFPNDSKTDMLISNIFGATNYFPGLLQLYCAKLIEAMKTDYAGYEQFDTPPYVIREEHIKKALADKSLEQQIREKFVITLKVDEDDYYYQLALLVAFRYHNYAGHIDTSPKAILETAEDYGMAKIASLSIDKLQALLDEMTELNIFQRVGKDDYRFTRRNFLDMMGLPQEIDSKILEYIE